MKSEFLRFARRGLRQGTWPLFQRYLVAKRIVGLPPVSIIPRSDFAVHMLVCERDALMLHWAVRSFAFHFREPFSLVIHDDGSCSSRTLDQFSRSFPGSKIIRRAEGQIQIANRLKKYPRLVHRSQTSFASIKWIDFYLLGDSKFVVFLDSDVLFFAKPVELFSEPRQTLWMRDSYYSLHLTQDEARDSFGVASLPQLNTGLGLVSRSLFDPELADRVLDIMNKAHVAERALKLGLPKVDDMPYNAVYTAARNDFQLLPESYAIATEAGLKGVIAKHYTTPFRFLFYEEGIPRVAQQLEVALPRWLRERG